LKYYLSNLSNSSNFKSRLIRDNILYLNHFIYNITHSHSQRRFNYLRAKIKQSIISSLKDDLNFEINSPAALKHLSASTEEGESEFRQDL